MGKSERNKGANGEREVVKIFNAHGFKARRGMVFYHEPDMIVPEMPKLHFEVKRHEKISMPAWIRQSTEACKDGESPCVVFRQNRKEWWIALPLDKWLEDQRVNCCDCKNAVFDCEQQYWCNAWGSPARLVLSDDFCSKGEL